MAKTLGWHAIALAIVFASSLISSGCGGGSKDPVIPTPPPVTPPATITALQSSINHIVFMIQENRSFDHYFGQLNAYRAANGLPQDVDGLPANASNPAANDSGAIRAFHLRTVCHEDLSSGWSPSHIDFNRSNPTSSTPAMDGFVRSAANFAQDFGLNDLAGIRAMGYYDAGDLPYYYFMASQFATSDRWFSPMLAQTQPNRYYSFAATSAGHVYDSLQLPLANKTIFQLLDENNVSWKLYFTDLDDLGRPDTLFTHFSYFTAHPEKIVPVSAYLNDVAQGTLPAVSLIEGGFHSALDEHPGADLQDGAAHVASLINALMTSPSWKDSVFILTFDEGGGPFDHVPPPAAIHPDGIKPLDLQPGDVCSAGGANCDFDRYGFRVPLIVVSPFTRKNYVSHTTADFTAILKLIETRFKLPSLTRRDAAQIDMTEFFDFEKVPWRTPPAPPVQPIDGACYFDSLP